MVTHALQYIPMMNKVLYIDEGKIIFFGKPEDAMELPYFKKALSLEERNKYSELSKKKKKLKAIVMSEYNDTEQENLNSDTFVNKLKTYQRQRSRKKSEKIVYKEPTKIQSFKLIFSFCGGCCFLFCIILFCFFWRLTDSASDFIIAKWSAADDEVEPQINYFNWYLVTKLLGILFIFIRSYIIFSFYSFFNQ